MISQAPVKFPLSDKLFVLLYGPLPTDQQPGHWGIVPREVVATMDYSDDSRIQIKATTAKLEIFTEQLAEKVVSGELTPQQAKAEMRKFVDEMEQNAQSVTPPA